MLQTPCSKPDRRLLMWCYLLQFPLPDRPPWRRRWRARIQFNHAAWRRRHILFCTSSTEEPRHGRRNGVALARYDMSHRRLGQRGYAANVRALRPWGALFATRPASRSRGVWNGRLRAAWQSQRRLDSQEKSWWYVFYHFLNSLWPLMMKLKQIGLLSQSEKENDA